MPMGAQISHREAEPKEQVSSNLPDSYGIARVGFAQIHLLPRGIVIGPRTTSRASDLNSSDEHKQLDRHHDGLWFPAA